MTQETKAATIRIAQVIGQFDGGGAQRLAYNLAEALAASGVESTAIALRQAGGFATPQDNGVMVYQVGCDRQSKWSLVRGLLRLRKHIRTGRYDLIHVHGSASLPFVVLAMKGVRDRPRLWFTWHDSSRVLDGTPRQQRSMVDALSRCDRIYGSSRSVVERLVQRSGLDTVEVFVNGVPVGDETDARDVQRPRMIWAARLVPDKDPRILLEAANTLKQEQLDFDLTVAGSPLPHQQWYADELSARVDQSGLCDIVKMPGWVDDTPVLFRSAAIGVQTSHTEGLSMTLLEQMMAGLAIVATDVGDTAVAIEHEKTGLLIPPRDEAALTDALRRLITDPALRKRLGTAAREKALAEFSLDAMAQRVLRDLGLPVRPNAACAANR